MPGPAAEVPMTERADAEGKATPLSDGVDQSAEAENAFAKLNPLSNYKPPAMPITDPQAYAFMDACAVKFAISGIGGSRFISFFLSLRFFVAS
jgi:hypothetical protein